MLRKYRDLFSIQYFNMCVRGNTSTHTQIYKITKTYFFILNVLRTRGKLKQFLCFRSLIHDLFSLSIISNHFIICVYVYMMFWFSE